MIVLPSPKRGVAHLAGALAMSQSLEHEEVQSGRDGARFLHGCGLL